MKLRFVLLAFLLAACASTTPSPTTEPQIIFLSATPSPVIEGTATDEPLPFRNLTTPTAPPTLTLTPAPPTLAPTAVIPPSAIPLQPAVVQPALAPPTAVPVQPASDVAGAEQAVIDLTNAHRARNGLPPLARDETIMAIARARSNDMAARNYFGHNDPVTGAHLAREAVTAVAGFGRAGENIYWGGAILADFPAKAVGWFMGDAPHRANILNPNYTAIGVGIVWHGQGWMLTQDFGGP